MTWIPNGGDDRHDRYAARRGATVLRPTSKTDTKRALPAMWRKETDAHGQRRAFHAPASADTSRPPSLNADDVRARKI